MIRLQVVAFHMDGDAGSWYQWMDRNGALFTWEHFAKEIRSRFGSSVYEDPLGNIAKMMPTGSVAQYRTEFEALMNRIEGVTKSMFLNFFIWGLHPEIRRELLITPPGSLNESMTKAQLYEDRNDDLRRTGRKGGMPRVPLGLSAVNTEPDLGRYSNPSEGHTNITSHTQIAKIPIKTHGSRDSGKTREGPVFQL
ncbi:uncharacterized protein [Henckelia pumila]|uniref:uncharacterized protein n=1 Tax=Henckelia pumila TaxID=405737 RepID=UPI003C6DBC50